MDKVIDLEEIRKWHKTFKREGELFEIRILCGGNKAYSGYFTDIEDAIPLLGQYGQYQIYFTVNEVKPACSSRKQYNSFLFVSGSATSKNDIQHRWWLPIDIDVERPTDVSSTDEEKDYAHKKAGDVYKFLSENGFASPIVCDSSSGYHLYYPIDMDSTTETENVVKAFYGVLSNFFTDDRVKIDKVVGNADRIMRMPGSWGRKGRDSEERPHRKAHILFVPEVTERMTVGQIEAFIQKFQIKEEHKARTNHQFNYNQEEQFDLREFLSNNGIEVAKEMPYGNGGTKLVLKECPFDSSHKAPDSAIFVTAQGAIGFKCLHNSCADHDWRALRLKFDPNAYDYENRQQQQQYRQYVPQVPTIKKPKYEIKEELPEIGEKWLSMSSIKKVDLTEIESVKTGFVELDNNIVGLNMSEVTLLSGSNSSGKSSWLNTLMLNIISQNYKVALWSGELPPYILKAWVQMVAAGKAHLRESQYKAGKYYVPDNISQRIDEWLDGKMFLYNNEYGNTWEQIFHDMKKLLNVGVKVFILDNLFSLNIDLLEGDRNNKQKELILQIKDFAKKEKVHIILVAHPRKSMAFLRKNDISGTSDLTNAVDDIFIIHRVNNDFLRMGEDFFGKGQMGKFEGFGNVIEVCKNRMYGIVDLMVGMHYEIESRRFKNTPDENVRYGWEEEPHQAMMSFAQQTPQESDDSLPFSMSDGLDAPF